MKEKYEDDLREIREIMSRSSRFISLSGLSGISAGILGMAGAYLAWKYVFIHPKYLSYQPEILPERQLIFLFLIALGTLLMAFLTTTYFTRRASKMKQQKAWDYQSKRLLLNILIPLISGGVLGLILVFKGLTGLALSLSLIFYGLALVNGSNYTLKEVRILGLFQLVLGLGACLFIELGLLFWAIGFGPVHILYGISMNLKYKS